MPELVESTRRAFRDDRTSPDTCVAELTFADIATRYLDRHVRRHLVPRAYALALYAHTFLATVEIPAPNGALLHESKSSHHDPNQRWFTGQWRTSLAGPCRSSH